MLTYALTPVVGFAFVLTLLGFMQCKDDDRTIRPYNIALVAWVHLTLVGVVAAAPSFEVASIRQPSTQGTSFL